MGHRDPLPLHPRQRKFPGRFLSETITRDRRRSLTEDRPHRGPGHRAAGHPFTDHRKMDANIPIQLAQGYGQCCQDEGDLILQERSLRANLETVIPEIPKP